MPVPQEILKLVERFDSQSEAYQSGKYNEAQIRAEFIDPLFKALGWDIHNERGYAEAYKDVIHEDAIKIGGATEAPDLCFRIGGTRKFFVECKKPSVNIKDDVHPAYQLRRYAWSARLPLSILTDFNEVAVYDCRAKPNKTDTSAIGRLMYFTSNQFAEKWDEFAAIFSHEAVLKGSFDKFAESTKGRKGTASVDDVFLEEIERWRAMLARNIAIRNEKLSQRELNFAVQRIIDRIIFLRICEDRGIEPYGRLMTLRNGERVYPRLCEFFQRADERYNSGLFHFQREKDRPEAPDELTLSLKIDDKDLKDIIGNLYYPESPYEFSVLPADILGHVYERFLGKVIRLTAGHQAKVEEKPEVRKAGGVYYTPTYIVDYIVKNTVGKLLEGKTPKQAAKLKILDPACGSGSFLLGAYQYLLNWHRDYYVKDGPEKNRKVLYQASGDYRLMTDEKKRILLNNIYGVDIDSQAVEVTKLSLLLKVLEGESQETITKQFELFHQRALPDLGSNIKCGNSLIGPDFYKDRQGELFGEDEMFRINAFDWQAEFAEIMKSGGFDAVIGNPPYIRVRIYKEIYPKESEYLEQHFNCAVHVWDLYLLIFERSIFLLNNRGYASFIIPIQTLHQPNCESLRHILLNQTTIEQIADLSTFSVFHGPTVKNCIIACRKGVFKKHNINVLKPTSPQGLITDEPWQWNQEKAVANLNASLKVDLLSPMQNLCIKLREQSWELKELAYSTFGMRSCAKGKGAGGKDRLITDDPTARYAKPYLEGRDIGRYDLNPTGKYIRYIPTDMYSPRCPELFETPKIISQTMLSKKRLVATLDRGGYYVEQSLACILPNGIINDKVCVAELPLEYLLGVINSTLEGFYFSTCIIDYSLGGGLIHATPGSHDALIIPKANKEQIDHMVQLVMTMLDLHKRVAATKTDHERTLLERQISATDREIDRLVYELYGLTEEEIKIVEGATSGTEAV